MTGDSITSAIGYTTPPYAARFISGLAIRAIIALKAGPSRPINNQLAASGHHVLTMRFIVMEL
jgi:hypothetical protein